MARNSNKLARTASVRAPGRRPAKTKAKARSPAAAEAASVQAEPLARIPELCGNCEHWRGQPNNPSFGTCRLSAKALLAPLTMPDRGSCSGWTVAARFAAAAAA